MCPPTWRWSACARAAPSSSGTRRRRSCRPSSASTRDSSARWPAWFRSTAPGPRPRWRIYALRRCSSSWGREVPIDTGRLEELHIVRKFRETVRRWWGIELSFTDANGFVLDHGKGIIIPPQNRICTACLGDKEGLRRCNASIEKAVASVGDKGALLGPCHMGLEIVAAPIQFNGNRQGSLFACGFLLGEKAEAARAPAISEARSLKLPVLPEEDS